MGRRIWDKGAEVCFTLKSYWWVTNESTFSASVAAHHVQGRGAPECGGEENTSCQGGWPQRQQTTWTWRHSWGAGRWDSRASTWRNVPEARIWSWKGDRATPVNASRMLTWWRKPFFLQICEFQPWVSWNVALACYRLLRLILFWPLFVCVMVLWFFFF